ncbi:glycosyltransferase family 2 protein [Solwaraspora sp. WMMD406]|uniref:glycosyltransferase family 2 protein n=1 Tax=Solwaraspora sp. WMMD406 TaxID=3016095 RepID=UPI0024159F66|nr:glycosyltransferase family 2 protein [Solwaraspora sp. WMMD406]MDG4763558.1 glycosyltransferase family 2 protein [Solwaraspora sp. WMMD406]
MRLGPRVATIVVNYRHNDDTVRCLNSLQASKDADQQLIVVDNTEPGYGGTDLTELVDPAVRVLSAGGNVGFAAGCNIGIKAALESSAEFFWLVNPDAVVGRQTLSHLLATATDEPDAGIIGSRILDGGHPPRILFNGGVIEGKGSTSHADAGKLDRDVPDGPVRDVDYVTGACFLIRRNVVRQVGLIPEEYFLYYEETDFCLRAQRAGWRTVIAPYARTWHHKRSTGKLPSPYYIYYMCRNRVHFSQRFFAASFEEIEAELTPFIDGWSRRVATHAPHLSGSFDKLVQLALADGQDGRLGRRDDISDFVFA